MSPFRLTPFSSDSKWTPGRRKHKQTSRKGHRQQAPSSSMDLPKALCYINRKSQNCSLFFPPSPGTHFSSKLSVQSEYFLSLDVMPVSSIFLYDFMILILTLQSLPHCKRNSFYNKNFYNCVRNSKKTPTGLPGSCLHQPGWNCFLFMDEANETVCFVRQEEKFVMTPVSELTPSNSVCLRFDLRPGLAWSLSEFPGLNKHSYNKDCLFTTLMLLFPSLKSSNTPFLYVSNSDRPTLTWSLCSPSMTQISPSGDISGARIANEIPYCNLVNVNESDFLDVGSKSLHLYPSRRWGAQARTVS